MSPSISSATKASSCRCVTVVLKSAALTATCCLNPGKSVKMTVDPFGYSRPSGKPASSSRLPSYPDDVLERMPAVSSRAKSARLDALELLPSNSLGLDHLDHWQPGEAGAHQQLDSFLDRAVMHYQDDRNRPDIEGRSMLSAHLHFGEISPQQIIGKTDQTVNISRKQGLVTNAESFIQRNRLARNLPITCSIIFRIPWTDLIPNILMTFPGIKIIRPTCVPGNRVKQGIPLVDAGMRQLWYSGWMHNRVRMIVASLLTKNLLVPWQQRSALVLGHAGRCGPGEQHPRLAVDCRLRSADAAPYFRIFNPVIQSTKI